MKILFYNPAPTQRRFVPFEAIKGSAFFRRPNYDAMRLAYLSRAHDFFYYDERIEEKPVFPPDIVVVNVPLNLARYIESTVRKKWNGKTKIICYGFYPTLYSEENRKVADTVVIGDIANIWKKILSDAKNKKLAEVYTSDEHDQFRVDRMIEQKYGFTPIVSQLRTSFGCTCSDVQKDFCYENIFYKKFVKWNINSVVEEISRTKRKIIDIRDDDFLYDADYAIKILEKCWRYKKMWIFQTKQHIFDQPHILPFLRDNGVRIIYLKEDWISSNLIRDIENKTFVKEKKHQVDLIHSNRIAVGCKLRLGYDGEHFDFYRTVLKFLMNIKADFIQTTVQTPIPHSNLYNQYYKDNRIVKDLTLYDQWMPVVHLPGIEPQALYSWMEWLRDRFYSWDSILLRNIAVSPKLGIYNTTFFYLIPNLAYRNNFLEKVGYPP
jgi:radical SAM superfamily enzyme YgiQ (UPF0313 family)